MAGLGQIIFYSMVTLIFIITALLILILALTFSTTSSEVMSSNTMPVANLGDNQLLSCYLNTGSAQTTVKQLTVTWEKNGMTGLVYQYTNGAPDLGNQNSQFQGRTQLFPNGLVTGNASLLLRNVGSSDNGDYTCTISSSDGGGKVNIHLRTAAFSAPTFTLSNNTLKAVASRWFPKPNVTWSNSSGAVLQGITELTPSSTEMFNVTSRLQPVQVSNTYTCRIYNNVVAAVSDATGHLGL
uniref:V-set domain-containing T-cell activation inhibitor 1 n=1 Tax=Monopterus albus TaxID=43700 RepID=UPI0009B42D4E|nr:V-set domain-containing T-cell activation inhibitor 1 [Monopterus albus]